MHTVKRDQGIEDFRNKLAGADCNAATQADLCVPPPIGCGEPATEFRDELSRREFGITGMCQQCQDAFEAMCEESDE